MKLLPAIAFSATNKAKGINDAGASVIVQQRYDRQADWYHIWYLSKGGVVEADIQAAALHKLKAGYQIDSEEEYWSSM